MAQPKPSRRPEKQADQQHTRDETELSFRAQLTPTSAKDEDRTIDLVWSVGSEVRRYDWRSDEDYLETLSMEAKHVRLGRLNDGGPVLDTHSRWSVRDILGSIVPGTAKVDGKQGTAKVRFSMRDDVTPIWADVKAGIVRSVSVGYAVHKWERTPATDKTIAKRVAVDWEPHEISMVPIPADAGAGTRSADEDLARSRAQERNNMAETAEEKAAREAAEAKRALDQENELKRAREAEAIKREQEAEAKRAKDIADAAAAASARAVTIFELCELHKVPNEQRAAWLASNESVTAIKVSILDGMGKRSEATHISPATGGNGEREQHAVRDAASALLRRAGEKVEGEGHRNFGDGGLLRMAEIFLGMRGVNTRQLSKHEIAKRALGTEDFTSVLYLAGEKMTRQGYEAYPLVHRSIFRKTTSPDFREKHQLLVSAGTILPEIPENGIIPQSAASKEQSKYAIKSYGSIINFTRKMMIDDDISAITTIASKRGRSVAETERFLVWTFVMGTSYAGPLAQDGVAMFDDSAHGNFPTASGTPISDVTLTAARKSFRNRKSPDGFAMNASLKHIVTGVAGEAAWDVLLNGMYVPTSTSGVVTPRMRQVELHVEPLIHDSKKHWYGFADVNQVDSFEYAYLDGAEGPRLEQRNGFNPEGIEFKVCMDFGIGAIDFRGSYLQRET